jgi:hypothetical protein
MEISLSIPAKAFSTVYPFISNKKSLEAISCIYIDPLRICALNGHALLMYENPNKDTPFIVGKEFILIEPSLSLVKESKKKNAYNIIYKGERLTLMDTYEKEIYIEPGEAFRDYQYPDFEQVLARRESKQDLSEICFPYSCFDLIKKAFGKNARIKFEFTGKKDPCFFTIEDSPEYLGIIMPMSPEY